jgi:hypothetical protein
MCRLPMALLAVSLVAALAQAERQTLVTLQESYAGWASALRSDRPDVEGNFYRVVLAPVFRCQTLAGAGLDVRRFRTLTRHRLAAWSPLVRTTTHVQDIQVAGNVALVQAETRYGGVCAESLPRRRVLESTWRHSDLWLQMDGTWRLLHRRELEELSLLDGKPRVGPARLDRQSPTATRL